MKKGFRISDCRSQIGPDGERPELPETVREAMVEFLRKIRDRREARELAEARRR